MSEYTKKIIEPISTASERVENTMYIQFVLDASHSFTRIFSVFYKKWNLILTKCKNEKLMNPKLKIYYGLTVFNDQIHPMMMGARRFTDDESEFTQAIGRIAFKAYKKKQTYLLNEAVKEGIETLEKYAPKNAGKGILFFSDSTPEEKFIDFSNVSGCGIDFAKGYLYSSKYCPIFKFKSTDEAAGEIFELENFINYEGYKMVDDIIEDIKNIANK